jgi:hypothetical protein
MQWPERSFLAHALGGRRRGGVLALLASVWEADARPVATGDADVHPASFGEADVRPASLGWWRRVRHRSGKRMSIRRQRGGGCVSSGGWERWRGWAEASGAAQFQRVGEQSVASQGWLAVASPSRRALGFHKGGSALVGCERMDSIPIGSGGRAVVGGQLDPHVRHGQRDGNGVGGLHRCDFEIGRVKLSTLLNYG